MTELINWTKHGSVSPRGRRGWHVGKECATKARNHSRVAEALPPSEGIAYKSQVGEIVMCRRVGRMGPISEDGLGQNNPDPSEGPWGWRLKPSTAAFHRVVGPTQCGTTESDHEAREGRPQTRRPSVYAGSGFSGWETWEGAV